MSPNTQSDPVRRTPSRCRQWAHGLMTLVLLAAVVCGQTAGAQQATLAEADLPQAPSAQTAPQGTPKKLSIVILDGDEALNNIRERTAREPIVEVQDENHRPVAGALILFSLHSGTSGAGGAFGSTSTLSVTTGADGRAVAHGLQPNQTAGQYTITVSASAGGVAAAEVTLHEQNVTGAPDSQTSELKSNPVKSNSPGAISSGRRLFSRRNVLIASGAIVVVIAVIFLKTGSDGTTITAGAGTVHR